MTTQFYGPGQNLYGEDSLLNCHISPQIEIPEEIGLKYDKGKRPWFLLPWNEVGEIVDVLKHGMNKYGKYNWKKVDDYRDRYFSALIRHLIAWYNGQEKDNETKLSHLAHAGCNILFLMWFDNNRRTK